MNLVNLGGGIATRPKFLNGPNLPNLSNLRPSINYFSSILFAFSIILCNFVSLMQNNNEEYCRQGNLARCREPHG